MRVLKSLFYISQIRQVFVSRRLALAYRTLAAYLVENIVLYGIRMEAKQASKLAVGSIVRDPVSTVQLSTHVFDVARTMVEQNVGSVVVVRDHEPLGIITERDIIERIVFANRNIREIVAQEIMTAPLLTIDSNRTVEEALSIMRKNHLRRLVVVKGDKLVGIVTERRLLLALGSLG